MFLIILGLVLIIGSFATRSMENIHPYSRTIRLVGIFIIAIGVTISCFIQVDAGQVGVKKLFGKIQPDVLESGLHFINPLYEVEKVDVKSLNYTMSGIHDEGDKAGDDAIRVLTQTDWKLPLT
jgi:regulator of protease activity HflC (stomatin/prohibitin superfamily)